MQNTISPPQNETPDAHYQPWQLMAIYARHIVGAEIRRGWMSRLAEHHGVTLACVCQWSRQGIPWPRVLEWHIALENIGVHVPLGDCARLSLEYRRAVPDYDPTPIYARAKPQRVLPALELI